MSYSSIIYDVPTSTHTPQALGTCGVPTLSAFEGQGQAGVGTSDLGTRLCERMNEGEKTLESNLIN